MELRDALWIFWDGEEVPGVTVYGYWSPGPAREHVLPANRWSGQSRTFRLSGDGWAAGVRDIRVE